MMNLPENVTVKNYQGDVVLTGPNMTAAIYSDYKKACRQKNSNRLSIGSAQVVNMAYHKRKATHSGTTDRRRCACMGAVVGTHHPVQKTQAVQEIRQTV